LGLLFVLEKKKKRKTFSPTSVACQQLFRLGLLLFVLQKKRKEKKRKKILAH